MSHPANEIRNLLAQPRLSKSDLISLLSHSRILIEEAGLQSDYAYLNLYCNWALHPKIDRMTLGHRILERITEILLQFGPGGTGIEEVSSIVSVPGLRKDFIRLFTRFGFPTQPFTNVDIWKKVFGVIGLILVERPLTFPEGQDLERNRKAKAVHSAIQTKARGTDLAVREFAFYKEQDGT